MLDKSFAKIYKINQLPKIHCVPVIQPRQDSQCLISMHIPLIRLVKPKL